MAEIACRAHSTLEKQRIAVQPCMGQLIPDAGTRNLHGRGHSWVVFIARHLYLNECASTESFPPFPFIHGTNVIYAQKDNRVDLAI